MVSLIVSNSSKRITGAENVRLVIIWRILIEEEFYQYQIKSVQGLTITFLRVIFCTWLLQFLVVNLLAL